MREAIEIAPFGPTKLEVYVACRALRQPVPRSEVKALKRRRMLNSDGELTEEGRYEIGRLRQLRKEGKVAEKAKPPILSVQVLTPTIPQRNYPGVGPRRKRRLEKRMLRTELKRATAQERADLARLEKLKKKIAVESEAKLFESAYR